MTVRYGDHHEASVLLEPAIACVQADLARHRAQEIRANAAGRQARDSIRQDLYRLTEMGAEPLEFDLPDDPWQAAELLDRAACALMTPEEAGDE